MFSRKVSLYVSVFRNHLARQQIDSVSEILILRIVDPENTTHTYIFEIAQAKVCHPHIFRHQLRERNIVESKHIFHRFHSDILLKLAVFIKIGVRVLL